jgi:hypothetical protein
MAQACSLYSLEPTYAHGNLMCQVRPLPTNIFTRRHSNTHDVMHLQLPTVVNRSLLPNTHNRFAVTCHEDTPHTIAELHRTSPNTFAAHSHTGTSCKRNSTQHLYQRHSYNLLPRQITQQTNHNIWRKRHTVILQCHWASISLAHQHKLGEASAPSTGHARPLSTDTILDWAGQTSCHHCPPSQSIRRCCFAGPLTICHGS